MPLWKLTALSEKARSYAGPHGCDLVLDPQRETKVGRAVAAEGNNYVMPAMWVQLSSNHCRLYYDGDKDCWMVVDSSTNGVYVNGVKAIKGKPTMLQPGDSVRLSSIPPNEPENVFEYRLDRVEGGGEPAASKVELTPRGLAAARQHNKRKEAGGGASDVSESMPQSAKKPRGAPPSPAGPAAAGGGGGAGAASAGGHDVAVMLQLKKANQELRDSVTAKIQEKEAIEAALAAKEAELKQAQAARAAECEAAERAAAEALQQAKEAAGAEAVAAKLAQAAAEAAAREASEQAQRVGQELQRAQQGAEEARQELQRAQQGAEEARQEADAQRAQREVAVAELQCEQEARARAEEALGAAMEQVGRLEAAAGQLERERGEAAARLVDAEGARARAEERAEQLGTELLAALERAAAAEQRAAAAEAAGGELRSARAGLEAALGRAQAELAESRGRLETMQLCEQELKERQLVVDACVHHVELYAADWQAAKQELDASYEQVAAAKRLLDAHFGQATANMAKADRSYNNMMGQVRVITEHLRGGASQRLTAPAPAGPEGGAKGAAVAAAGAAGQAQQEAEPEQPPLGTAAVGAEEGEAMDAEGAEEPQREEQDQAGLQGSQHQQDGPQPVAGGTQGGEEPGPALQPQQPQLHVQQADTQALMEGGDLPHAAHAAPPSQGSGAAAAAAAATVGPAAGGMPLLEADGEGEGEGAPALQGCQGVPDSEGLEAAGGEAEWAGDAMDEDDAPAAGEEPIGAAGAAAVRSEEEEREAQPALPGTAPEADGAPAEQHESQQQQQQQQEQEQQQASPGEGGGAVWAALGVEDEDMTDGEEEQGGSAGRSHSVLPDADEEEDLGPAVPAAVAGGGSEEGPQERGLAAAVAAPVGLVVPGSIFERDTLQGDEEDDEDEEGLEWEEPELPAGAEVVLSPGGEDMGDAVMEGGADEAGEDGVNEQQENQQALSNGPVAAPGSALGTQEGSKQRGSQQPFGVPESESPAGRGHIALPEWLPCDTE